MGDAETRGRGELIRLALDGCRLVDSAPDVARGGGGGIGIKGIPVEELTTLGNRSCTAEAGGRMISVKPGAPTVGDVSTAGVPTGTEVLDVGAEVARLCTAVFDTCFVGSAGGH